MRHITPFERKRLALEALMSERTVQKAYLFPMRVRESTLLRLARAYAAAHSATLGEALRWLIVDRKLKERAEATLECDRVKSGHLVRILGGETGLAHVDAQAVDRYIDQRLQEGSAPNTVSKELTVLRGALKVAKRRGEYTRDIAQVMPSGFSPQFRPRERFLSGDEARALLAELSPDHAARVAFIIATGARWGESERARREDVDMAKGFVTLRGTKTKNAPRVGVGAELIEHALLYAEGKEGLLFGSWDNVRRDIQTACRRAKIAKASPNDLRRTYATWLRQAMVEPHLIGAAMGHADSSMVERVYGRLPPESLAIALRWRVEGRSGPAPTPTAPAPKAVGNACSACVANACDSPVSETPERRPATPVSARFVVSGDGIEPPTRGFSRSAEAAASGVPSGNSADSGTSSRIVEHHGPPDKDGVGQNLAQVDAVEAALADALQRAAVAGAFDAVGLLTAELKARREARANVVSLEAARARRGERKS